MTVELAKEFHFDLGVYNITAEEAGTLLDKIVVLVEDMDANINGGCVEYTWVDTATHYLAVFLYSWRNRINRFLGKNPWHFGRMAIGNTVYIPPKGELP